MNNVYDVVIVGAGPAGMSAAIYAKRANLKTLVFEASSYGGQIINSHLIENYPAISEINGFDFATSLYNQVLKQGAEFKFSKVTLITRNHIDNTYSVQFNEGSVLTKTVIIATGVKNRKPDVDNLEYFTGRGISYCAVCDGAFYRGKNVIVVGGGNTAFDDAIYLSKLCKSVTLIHRSEKFKAEVSKINMVNNIENFSVIKNSVIKAISGDSKIEKVSIENTLSHEISEIDTEGVFIAIGQIPDNECFSPIVSIDGFGYIKASEDCLTNAQGIFTAGDCRTKEIRQLATATSDGAVAALMAYRYLTQI